MTAWSRYVFHGGMRTVRNVDEVLGLVKEVPHTGGADADEHLDELGAADGEERDARFAGDGPGEQCLARAGRADEQHATWDTGTQSLEALA